MAWLLSVENVDGVTESITLIDFDRAPANEAPEVGVWTGGGVKSPG